MVKKKQSPAKRKNKVAPKTDTKQPSILSLLCKPKPKDNVRGHSCELSAPSESQQSTPQADSIAAPNSGSNHVSQEEHGLNHQRKLSLRSNSSKSKPISQDAQIKPDVSHQHSSNVEVCVPINSSSSVAHTSDTISEPEFSEPNKLSLTKKRKSQQLTLTDSSSPTKSKKSKLESDVAPEIDRVQSEPSIPDHISDSEGGTRTPVIGSPAVTDTGADKKDDVSDDSALGSSQPSSTAAGEAEDESGTNTPYYLINFSLILRTVTDDSFYSHLFNDADNATLQAFSQLSDEGQMLYVRLFGRLYRWIRESKISYPKIAEKLGPTLAELTESGLVQDESGLTDLDEILSTLPAPELKQLAKTLHMGAGKQGDLVTLISKHCHQGNASNFFSSSAGTTGVVCKRAKGLLGCCYRLARAQRQVFLRVMMLFGLHATRGEDEDQAGGQQPLLQILLSYVGTIKYPDYAVFRETQVFRDRAALLQFAVAIQTECEISEALQVKDYTRTQQIYDGARTEWERLRQDKEVKSFDCGLVEFLRVYTAGSVYTRVMSYAVEMLQFVKQYREAANLLEILIAQDVYQLNYRGRWYDRLALNLDYHLKEHNKALTVISSALNDHRVRSGHRLSLWQRAQKICSSKSNKFLRERWSEFKEDPMANLKECLQIKMQARQLPATMTGGGHSVWVSRDPTEGGDGDGVTMLKSVEYVAMAHYKDSGYQQGIHGEGGTFRSLFCVFLWDVIYATDIPDVFYNRFQAGPLDLQSLQFYENRKALINNRLAELEDMSVEELCAEAGRIWERYEGCQCAGVSWDLFTGLQHFQGLVRCVGGRFLAGIMRRMAMNTRHVTGGVPDLCMWDPDTLKFKMVEVKGPSDRLSTKQLLWIDHLMTLGVDVEVCHVEAVSSKKLRLQSVPSVSQVAPPAAQVPSSSS